MKKVTKPQLKENELSVEGATALVLVTTLPCVTQRMKLTDLFKEVKKLIPTTELTLKTFKNSLRKWFEEGWAMVNDNIFQVMRAGRSKVMNIAEEASMPPQPANR